MVFMRFNNDMVLVLARLQRLRLKFVRGRVSPKLAAVVVVFAVVVYNEVLSFFVSSLLWPNLNSASQDDLRILFVADPQLVGLRDEPMLIGVVTRWDSDKYLKSGFFQAVGYVRPDVVVFLGDLLDEGSKASDDEYISYIHRFRNVFKMPTTVKSIFVSGDNDVGGEGFDAKLPWKIDRFRKHFEYSKAGNYSISVSSIKHVDFHHLSIDYGEHITQAQIEELSNMRAHSAARYRITCNHMPLLNRDPVGVSKVIEILQPHIMVTAHTHLFRLYYCSDCQPQTQESSAVKKREPSWSKQSVDLRNMPRPLTFNLNVMEKLYELIIPTCSYRMGVPNMGYGAAVISKNGQMKFDILWLPSRYRQLALYVIILLLLAIWFISTTLYKYFKILISLN